MQELRSAARILVRRTSRIARRAQALTTAHVLEHGDAVSADFFRVFVATAGLGIALVVAGLLAQSGFLVGLGVLELGLAMGVQCTVDTFVQIVRDEHVDAERRAEAEHYEAIERLARRARNRKTGRAQPQRQ